MRRGRAPLAARLENNPVVRRIQAALADAQVAAGVSPDARKTSYFDLTLLALLYISLRCTPSGKMLNRLYVDHCPAARDTELRCLRAMASFKDTRDDEEASTLALQQVLLCFDVSPEFDCSVVAVLHRQLAENDSARAAPAAPARPLLCTYAQLAVQQRSTLATNTF